jgi:hypothetical protein
MAASIAPLNSERAQRYSGSHIAAASHHTSLLFSKTHLKELEGHALLGRGRAFLFPHSASR